MMKCVVCGIKIHHPVAGNHICVACWEKPFEITNVTREDMLEVFNIAQIERFDDPAMEKLAQRMRETYIENRFWCDIEIIGKIMLADA